MSVILIIDDEIANVELIRVYLEYDGHTILACNSGKDGYKMAIDHQPDLIFTDLRMPAGTWDGYKTAQQLKSNTLTQHIPIIALTAAGYPDRAMEAGCDVVLNRPFQCKDLQAIINQYVAPV